MATKIFVGKLSYDTTEKTLEELFGAYGEVASVAVIMDRATDRSKGFAFIEMTDLKSAQTAIKELDNKEVDGRNIAVSAAKEREDKPRNNAGFKRSW
jgi:RNA recognition motif-containing protein